MRVALSWLQNPWGGHSLPLSRDWGLLLALPDKALVEKMTTDYARNNDGAPGSWRFRPALPIPFMDGVLIRRDTLLVGDWFFEESGQALLHYMIPVLQVMSVRVRECKEEALLDNYKR